MTPEEKLIEVKKIIDRMENWAENIDSWSNYMSIQTAAEQYINELKEITK